MAIPKQLRCGICQKFIKLDKYHLCKDGKYKVLVNIGNCFVLSQRLVGYINPVLDGKLPTAEIRFGVKPNDL